MEEEQERRLIVRAVLAVVATGVTEEPPANLSYTRGVVAMAKELDQPPGYSGSQFFVVTGSFRCRTGATASDDTQRSRPLAIALAQSWWR